MKKENNKEQDERLLFNLTVTELRALVKELLLETSNEKPSEPNGPDELIPRKDLAREFKVSLVTIDRWTKLNLLPKAIKQGGRIYFSRADINKMISEKGERNA
ncbi:MAG: putative DNA-binding transcriptional regulator AlpA [Parvicellaceae bacterium]|jgi:predicted DNA-binding transcriptional regulator AlpA